MNASAAGSRNDNHRRLVLTTLRGVTSTWLGRLCLIAGLAIGLAPSRSVVGQSQPGPQEPGPQEPGAPATRRAPDAARLAAAGIRKLTGRHLTLYTDVPQDEAPEQESIDELPRLFDEAVAQWCGYFERDPREVRNWKMTGYLIDRKERFQGLGLLPADLPPFLHGYQRGDELWMNEQPTAYYRRHLLLHEGTHAFMRHCLGGAGPPWYMEGTAELLATHRWQGGQLQLGYLPSSKEQVPGWGRIKIVKDELAAGRGMVLERIMLYDDRAHLRNEPYGWCWAAAMFLDRHPASRDSFRRLREQAADTGLDFSRQYYRQLAGQWARLQHDWQLFVWDLDYGYDIPRCAIDSRETRPLPDGGALVRIAADRGWQSSGLKLEADRDYRITASGRFQVDDRPQVWWSEPGGVTLRYVQGRPLGLLLGAVRDEQNPPAGLSPLTRPFPIGLRQDVRLPAGGTLYLKINDSPSELENNAGSLTVRIEPQ